MAVAAQGDIDGVGHVLDALKKDLDNAQLTAHINFFSYSGGSAVMFAAAGGHDKATSELIKLGADVNGVTAVHVAAQGGHLETVEILIEAKADVTILDDEERSPLLLAVKGNHGEVASSLVKGGADPNTPYIDDDGASHDLLMDSIVVENGDFTLLLIENGADLYDEDDHKVTTLLQASHRGMVDVLDALLQKHASAADEAKEGWIDSPSDEGITPLIASCSEGHVEAVKLLIDAKADVNAKDKDQTNSLMAASARGHTDIVELLLNAEAMVNEQNVDGHSALMFAYNGKNQVETLWERYTQFVKESEVGSSEKKDVDDGGTGR